MHPRRRLIWTTVAFGCASAISVAVGVCALVEYESAPGRVAKAPETWPLANTTRATDRPTLVLVAHPHCPCTRATIGELAQIMAQVEGKLSALVLFSRPTAAGAEWDETDLWRSAAAIPGVTVRADVDGAEAKALGAETSGHALLFSAEGKLLFSGGITPSRGHSGDNAGESSIVALVRNESATRDRTFVFGCSLPVASTVGSSSAWALK